MNTSFRLRFVATGFALFCTLSSVFGLLPEPGNIYYGLARDVFGVPYTPSSTAKVMMIRVIGTLDDPFDAIADDDITLAESAILAPTTTLPINYILRPSLDALGGTRYTPTAGRESDPVRLFIELAGVRYPVASAFNCIPVSDPVPTLGARGTIRIVNIRAIDDYDGDCISDTWEVFFFGDIGFDGQDDLDDDGMVNLTEFVGGTNPLLKDLLDVTPENRGMVLSKNGNFLTVDWPRDPARSYVMQWSSDLALFTDIPPAKLSGALLNTVDVTGLSTVFIRLRVSR